MQCCVLLDANFLLVPFQFKIDIYEELPYVVEGLTQVGTLSAVWEELEKKQLRSPRKQKFNRMISSSRHLFEAKAGTIWDFPNPERAHVDDLILKFMAVQREAGNTIILATNDRDLRYRALENGFPVCILRNQKKLHLFRGHQKLK